LDRRLGGPQSRSGRGGKEKNSQPSSKGTIYRERERERKYMEDDQNEIMKRFTICTLHQVMKSKIQRAR
jgi:hypothetical protein